MLYQSGNPVYVRHFHTEWSVAVGITGTVYGNSSFCTPSPTIQHSSLKLRRNQRFFFRTSPLQIQIIMQMTALILQTTKTKTVSVVRLNLWLPASIFTFVTATNETPSQSHFGAHCVLSLCPYL